MRSMPLQGDTKRAYQRDWYAKHAERLKAARNARRAATQARLRKIADAERDRPCADCGGSFPLLCMDFDHVRGEKRSAISNLVWEGASVQALKDEIAKCEVVCSNCHRIRTEARRAKLAPTSSSSSRTS